MQNLQRPEIFPHPVEKFQVIETHITMVLLTGDFAYKFKKPVDLEFLDFSTLEKRRYFCEQEQRLNKIYAPELYLEIVKITGDYANPTINGEGEVIEYGIKMRQFLQENLFTNLLLNNKLTENHLVDLAEQIAFFHQQASVAPSESEFGTPKHIYLPLQQNFDYISKITKDAAALKRTEEWVKDQFQRLEPVFLRRKQEGFIRQCHGDLHLNNIVLYGGKSQMFDCIEFNESLRWIDVMSDVGFLTMDLRDKNQRKFSWIFLNHYLTLTHDYAGLQTLRFYQTYRAMVREKVNLIQLQQGVIDSTKDLYEDYQHCIDDLIGGKEEKKSQLMIMHGLSGSGKSTVAKQLAATIGAIHLRTDVERIFLHKKDIYSDEAIQEVYDHCHMLAKMILKCGYSAIVDATFLKRSQRLQFKRLAEEMGVPFHIVICEVDEKTREQWLTQRNHDYSQADLEVAHKQNSLLEPLTSDEKKYLQKQE